MIKRSYFTVMGGDEKATTEEDEWRISFFQQVAGTFYGGVCEHLLLYSTVTDSKPSRMVSIFYSLSSEKKCKNFNEVSNKRLLKCLHFKRLPFNYPLSHFSTPQIFIKSCM